MQTDTTCLGMETLKAVLASIHGTTLSVHYMYMCTQIHIHNVICYYRVSVVSSLIVAVDPPGHLVGILVGECIASGWSGGRGGAGPGSQLVVVSSEPV